MPSDPAALLALAAKKNGLQNVGSAPWHLKATYDVMDDKGAVKETGTFEEFWISARRYKKSYTSPSFTQAEYSTEAGVMRVGSPDWPGAAEIEVERSFSPPFPDSASLAKEKFKLKDQKTGGITLKCVTSDNVAPSDLSPSSLHCFATDGPILRVVSSSIGLYDIFYNQLAVFRGVYVSRDISVKRLGKLFLHIHIDTLGALPTPDDSIIAAPADAMASGRRCPLGCTDVRSKPISSIQPRYPDEAKRARVQGAVFLRAIVSNDGAITNLEPMAGPPLLIESSLEAVRQWRYAPCTIDGEAVEVETIIRVVYSLR
jgi:TonB family protein